MRTRAATFGLAAALFITGCGDDGDKKGGESSAQTTIATTTSTTLSQAQLDKAKAPRVVLTLADLPGYTMDPPDPTATSSLGTEAGACINNNPVLARLGDDSDPRGTVGADFSKGENITVGSSVTFAETDDQARTAFTDLSAASFPSCFSKAFAADLKKQDPTFTNVSVNTTKLPAITVGDQSVGFRNVARVTSSGVNVTLNIDFTFIRVGRAVAELDTVAVATQFAAADRLRLATALAGRMAAP
jgi:hypothetical protein